MSVETGHQDEGIAIIGMAARFPGARDLNAFWKNLLDGVDSITHFTDEELEPSFYESSDVRAAPNYVKARGLIEDTDKFDANFFRYTPHDAAGIDPQQRVFMEVAWAALENAGCNPATYDGSIGVWAGMDPSTYLWENILPNRPMVDRSGVFPVILSNDKDYLATRLSYKLDLRGPSITVQTACSTGLVVVHNAFHALLSYQCDVAIAGVSSISVPQKRGYVYQEGAIGSRDGRCRPFDAQASGTVFSDGVGAVILKRLPDAIADGDTIYAVIKGSALNNDGARKAGFSAPSVDGQAEAILMAQAFAGITPDSISYVEAHGTATPLGDPIEIAALNKAFRAGTDRTGFCAIGSVKGNIGHLDSAAGIAGLIKATLALHHKKIPASLHYTAPNPQIDFAHSPFFVNNELRDWRRGATPRRAGVSSFGIGGTNAHVVLEEAPPARPTASSRKEQILVLSAKTAEALSQSAAQLADYLRAHPEVPLHDVAHTLQDGRQTFSHRLAVVARTSAEAAEALQDRSSMRTISGVTHEKDAPVAFMFPGMGSEYLNMASELYRKEPVFQTEFDKCARAFQPQIGVDIRQVVYPAISDEAAKEQMRSGIYAQVVTFAVEISLARLLMSWGIKPNAMIAHSVGEFVVACLAGVFSLEDLARIAHPMTKMPMDPPGSMTAVMLGAADVEPLLTEDVWIAAYNAPQLTSVSGLQSSVVAFEERVRSAGVWCKRVNTSFAYHSPLMESAVAPIAEVLNGIRFGKPQFRWVSSLTGDFTSDEQVMSVSYWTQQLCGAVRFSQGVQRLLKIDGQLLLEVGPGGALTTLARQHREHEAHERVFLSIGNIVNRDLRSVSEAVAQLWVKGVAIDWAHVRSGEARRHIPLPTYPFARQRHWIEPPSIIAQPALMAGLHSEPEAETDTGQESLVYSLLSDVSGFPKHEISGSSSFLELGFDSLLLTQLASAIHRKCGAEITLLELLAECSTPDKLARRLGETPNAPAVPKTAPAKDKAPASNVVFREICESDLDDVARLLANGFVGPSLADWQQACRHLAQRQSSTKHPRFGWLIEADGLIVGSIFTIYTTVQSNGRTVTRCNPSSWFVEKEYRGHSMQLLRHALSGHDRSKEEICYINTTPSPPTHGIMKELGFLPYSKGIYLTLAAANPVREKVRVREFDGDAALPAGLTEGEARLLAEHRSQGCLSLVCEAGGEVVPFVFILRKRYFPYAQLAYCRRASDIIRFAGSIGRFLALRGIFLLSIDAKGPIRGLVGRYFDNKPKFYHGSRPRLGDLAYTELALMPSLFHYNWKRPAQR